ncbi:MAG: D-glycero-beta-D-manno-heptose 1-phosphate adenylyltransferase [Acidobacteria bacterium]|nr:MAG: D-glycero-beta-D-manno-heptose 1-phosphate adenylyltransferase [Acidobacteriota bacterium]
MGRVVNLDEAAAATAEAKDANKRVVLANGHFDLIHVGHVRYLEGARAEGDFLVVGVNADSATRRLKGEGRPILPAPDRAELVAALEVVDLVVLFEEDNVATLLDRLRPNAHCKGTDYTEETVPERSIMTDLGGDTRIVGDPKTHSTRDLIQVILERFSH